MGKGDEWEVGAARRRAMKGTTAQSNSIIYKPSNCPRMTLVLSSLSPSLLHLSLFVFCAASPTTTQHHRPPSPRSYNGVSSSTVAATHGRWTSSIPLVTTTSSSPLPCWPPLLKQATGPLTPTATTAMRRLWRRPHTLPPCTVGPPTTLSWLPMVAPLFALLSVRPCCHC